VRRLLCSTQQIIIGYFADESFQAITSTGTNNSKQRTENTPKHTKHKINQLAWGKKNTKTNPKSAVPNNTLN